MAIRILTEMTTSLPFDIGDTIQFDGETYVITARNGDRHTMTRQSKTPPDNAPSLGGRSGLSGREPMISKTPK